MKAPTYRCSKCGEHKPKGEFAKHRGRSTGRAAHCKACNAAYMRSYYERNKARVNAANSQWYRENREAATKQAAAYRQENRGRIAAQRREARYGLSAEQYAEMVARQKGRCAICGDPPSKRGLNVDHCHQTGVVRGLLCTRCNTALGKFRDDPRLLRLAAEYVEQCQTRLLPVGSPHDGLEEQDRCADNYDTKEGE